MAALIERLAPPQSLGDMRISARFRLRDRIHRTHRDGRSFHILQIGNDTGLQGRAVLWSDAVMPMEVSSLIPGHDYEITLRQAFDPPAEQSSSERQRAYIEVVDIVPTRQAYGLSVDENALPRPELADRLRFWMDACPVPELEDFMMQVFSDTELAMAS